MMRVLVTGGAGFIGSHVSQRLHQNGWQVAIIDNFDGFYPDVWKRRNLQEAQKQGSFPLFECDIRDSLAINDVCARFRPSVLIHLAAKAGVRPSIEQPLFYEQTNVAGTYNLLAACQKYGVAHFIFGSSSSVYGDSTQTPFREDDRSLSPISPYAATKLAGESICYTYSHLYGLNVVCLRFFTVYGPRQRPDLAIHKFVRLIERGEAIPIFGHGTTGRDYTYVDDIVTGVCSAADWCLSTKAGRGCYEIVNLGNSSPVQLNDLIVAIQNATGKTAVRCQLPPQPGDVTLTWADISKAGRIFGYSPRTNLQDGLRHFVDWYRRHRENLIQ